MKRYILKHYKRIARTTWVVQWLCMIAFFQFLYWNFWWAAGGCLAGCVVCYLLTIVYKGVSIESFAHTAKMYAIMDPLMGIFGRRRRNIRRKLERDKPIQAIKKKLNGVP